MDNSNVYTLAEVAEILKVSDRTVRRYLKKYYTSDSKGLHIHGRMVSLLESDINGQHSDTILTHNDNSDNDVVIEDIEDIEVEDNIEEVFTPEDYELLRKKLIEYPLLKKQIANLEEQIQYHRKQVEYHMGSTESMRMQMQTLLEGFRERNYIEAKEKGFDDDNFVKP